MKIKTILGTLILFLWLFTVGCANEYFVTTCEIDKPSYETDCKTFHIQKRRSFERQENLYWAMDYFDPKSKQPNMNDKNQKVMF